ncbi:MAG: hypothetical protein IT423_15740 [Pirellulaceae bacterium]|nr:hypothetical protein [Pirellulaceae bacterium]
MKYPLSTAWNWSLRLSLLWLVAATSPYGWAIEQPQPPPADGLSPTQEAPPRGSTKSSTKPSAKTSAKQDGNAGDSKGDSAKKSPAKKSPAKKPSESAGKPVGAEQAFIRTVKGANNQIVKLQTAVVTYKAAAGPYSGAEVDLIGAIHIADKTYFKNLNSMFRSYEALLYEMVSDPEMVKQLDNVRAKDRSAISALQSGMKDMLGLSFQLEEIDYQAKNFVHADMNPEEFSQSLNERQEGIMQFMMRSMGSSLALQSSKKGGDLNMLSALLSGNRELAMKRVVAEQMEQMDGQLAAIAGDDGKSTLITERNAKALEVLKKELDAGKKRLGIFYGAGHFKHMHEEMVQQFQMKPTKTIWLDAWDMQN